MAIVTIVACSNNGSVLADQGPISPLSRSTMAIAQSPSSTFSRSTLEADSSSDLDGFAELTYQSVWSTYPMISDNDYESVEILHASVSLELDPIISDTDPTICEDDDVDSKFFDRASLAAAGAVCRSIASAQRRAPSKDMVCCTVLALASRSLPIDPIVVGKPFAIQIDRYYGGSVGLGISRVSRYGATICLYVKSIKEDGLVHAWNKANPNNMVCVGDRVLSINGHAIGERFSDELGRNTALRVEFIREIEQPRRSMAQDCDRSDHVDDSQVAELKRLQLAGLIPQEGIVYSKPIQKRNKKRRNLATDAAAQKALREREKDSGVRRNPETPRYKLSPPPRVKSPRRPQVELCAVGCGRHAAKGRAQDGKKFLTCCWGCPFGQGHDARCVDTVPPVVDRTMLNQLPMKPKSPMRSPRKAEYVKDANNRPMCKHGCGRHVAPGRSTSGNGFSSCCRGCANGVGHDVRCEGHNTRYGA